MSKTFRKAAMSTICMLIVAVMTLSGATYAWFTAGDTAQVDSISMEIVSAAGGLEVSKDDTTWANALAIDTKLTSVNPVSTTDAVDFVALKGYNPAASTEIEVTDTVTVEGQTKSAKEVNVIEQVLFLRNTGVEKITIDFRNTYIQDYDVDGEGTEKQATKIGQAARIAIFEGTGKDPNATGIWTLKGIIAPYYDSTANTLTDTAQNAGFNGVENDAVGKGFFAFGATGTYVTAVPGTVADSVKIELDGLDGNTPVSKMIKVVVWLEGQDDECSNPNAGGAFKTHLQFNKIDATIQMVDGTNSVPAQN